VDPKDSLDAVEKKNISWIENMHTTLNHHLLKKLTKSINMVLLRSILFLPVFRYVYQKRVHTEDTELR
jgi:hypothetical protein